MAFRLISRQTLFTGLSSAGFFWQTKSMFHNLFSLKRKSYCAFCKSKRLVYTKKHINILNVIACAIASAFIQFVISKKMDPQMILFFILFLITSEFFLRLRWRMSLVCQHCGFDPILYLKSTDKAAQKVKIHLLKRKEHPLSLIFRPLNLTKISKEQKLNDEFFSSKKISQKEDPFFSSDHYLSNKEALADGKGKLVSRSA